MADPLLLNALPRYIEIPRRDGSLARAPWLTLGCEELPGHEQRFPTASAATLAGVATTEDDARPAKRRRLSNDAPFDVHVDREPMDAGEAMDAGDAMVVDEPPVGRPSGRRRSSSNTQIEAALLPRRPARLPLSRPPRPSPPPSSSPQFDRNAQLPSPALSVNSLPPANAPSGPRHMSPPKRVERRSEPNERQSPTAVPPTPSPSVTSLEGPALEKAIVELKSDERAERRFQPRWIDLELRCAFAMTSGVMATFPTPPFAFDCRAMQTMAKFWREDLLKWRPKRPGSLGSLPRGSPVTRKVPSYKLDAIAYIWRCLPASVNQEEMEWIRATQPAARLWLTELEEVFRARLALDKYIWPDVEEALGRLPSEEGSRRLDEIKAARRRTEDWEAFIEAHGGGRLPPGERTRSSTRESVPRVMSPTVSKSSDPPPKTDNGLRLARASFHKQPQLVYDKTLQPAMILPHVAWAFEPVVDLDPVTELDAVALSVFHARFDRAEAEASWHPAQLANIWHEIKQRRCALLSLEWPEWPGHPVWKDFYHKLKRTDLPILQSLVVPNIHASRMPLYERCVFNALAHLYSRDCTLEEVNWVLRHGGAFLPVVLGLSRLAALRMLIDIGEERSLWRTVFLPAHEHLKLPDSFKQLKKML